MGIAVGKGKVLSIRKETDAFNFTVGAKVISRQLSFNAEVGRTDVQIDLVVATADGTAVIVGRVVLRVAVGTA